MAGEYSCYYIRGNYRVLPVLISIGIFGLVSNCSFKNRTVNKIASCTFGVQLIHAYPLSSEFLFKNVFDLETIITDRLLPIKAVVIVLIIYSSCTFIEYLRQLFFKITFDRKIMERGL